MSLVSVLESICAPLRALGITCLVGSQHVGTNEAPPRILMVPVSDSFTKGPAKWTAPNTARSFLTRKASVAVHVWAESPTGEHYAAVEELVRRLLEVMQDLLSGPGFDIAGGQWEDQDGQSIADCGRSYSFVFSVEMPVVRSTAAIDTTILSLQRVGSYGDSETGEVALTETEPTP